jgi:hypothetical protein
MKQKSSLWIPKFWEHLAQIERKTMRVLGTRKGSFFVSIYNDALDMNSAVIDAYGKSPFDLLFHTSWGFLKEIHWFHFLFVAGNYPLLKSRLRFIWEAMFRAYYAEKSPKAPPAIDDKLDWLETHKPRLDWTTCIAPVLKELFPRPNATEEETFRTYYRRRWQELNLYVHPSAYLHRRLIGDSVLHMKDAFDKEWALDTIHAATDVFDLVWLALLRFHERAIDLVARRKPKLKYPIVDLLLKCASTRPARISEEER